MAQTDDGSGKVVKAVQPEPYREPEPYQEQRPDWLFEPAQPLQPAPVDWFAQNVLKNAQAANAALPPQYQGWLFDAQQAANLATRATQVARAIAPGVDWLWPDQAAPIQPQPAQPTYSLPNPFTTSYTPSTSPYPPADNRGPLQRLKEWDQPGAVDMTWLGKWISKNIDFANRARTAMANAEANAKNAWLRARQAQAATSGGYYAPKAAGGGYGYGGGGGGSSYEARFYTNPSIWRL